MTMENKEQSGPASLEEVKELLLQTQEKLTEQKKETSRLSLEIKEEEAKQKTTPKIVPETTVTDGPAHILESAQKIVEETTAEVDRLQDLKTPTTSSEDFAKINSEINILMSQKEQALKTLENLGVKQAIYKAPALKETSAAAVKEKKAGPKKTPRIISNRFKEKPTVSKDTPIFRASPPTEESIQEPIVGTEEKETRPRISRTPSEPKVKEKGYRIISEQEKEQEAQKNKEYYDFKTNFLFKHSHDGLSDALLKAEELVPNFDSLTGGQKMLVMQNLADKIYAKVKEEGKATFEEKGMGAGFFKRLGLNIRKGPLTAKYETEALQGITSSDERLTEMATALTADIKALNIEGYLDSKERVTVDYLAGSYIGERTPSIDTYNHAATALSNIPYEWRLDEAPDAQKKAYAQAVKAFEEAERSVLPELLSQKEAQGSGSPEQDVAQAAAAAKTKMNLLSFISTDPEAAEKLREIGTQSATRRSVKKYLDSNFSYMLGGAAIRTGSAALTGTVLAGGALIALPGTILAASYLGHAKGRRNAQEKIQSEVRAAREGEQGIVPKGLFVDVEKNTQRLQNFMNRLSSAKTQEEKENITQELKTRMNYIQERLERGEVSFGKPDERFARQYQLLMTLQDAAIMTAATETAPQTKERIRLNDHIEEIRNAATHAVTMGRKTRVDEAALRGALIGAGAALTGGYVAQKALEYFGWPMSNAGLINENAVRKNLADMNAANEELTATATATSKNPTTEAVNAVNEKIEALRQTTKVENPTTTTINPTEVKFSSRGAGQTILNFRRTESFKALPEDIKTFFKGNVWEVTKALKEMDANGNSVNVGVGSKFGVSNTGEVFLTDSNTGTTHTLGKFENGKFIEGNPKLPYTQTIPKVEAPINQIPIEKPVDETLDVLKSNTSVSANTLPSPAKSVPESVYENSIPVADTAKVIAERGAFMYKKTVDDIFGTFNGGTMVTPGQESTQWDLVFKNYPADQLMKKGTTLEGKSRELYEVMWKLATTYQVFPEKLTVPQYLQKLLEAEARDKALQTSN